MRAYKFLRPGAVGPFSGFAWPTDGRWVEAARGVTPCRAGVHGCTVAHLPFWLGEELWEVELAEPAEVRGCKLVAPAGRLLRRVEAWDERAARDFAAAAVERIAELDVAAATAYMTEAMLFCVGDEARRDPFGCAAVSTLIAVEAAERAGGHDAVAREREAEAAWLAARLGLAPEVRGS